MVSQTVSAGDMLSGVDLKPYLDYVSRVSPCSGPVK